MEGGNSEQQLQFEKERRIRNLIDDFSNGLKKMKNEEEELSALELVRIGKLIMELKFLRTFVLFGNSTLDRFDYRISRAYRTNFMRIIWSLFDEDESMLKKYNLDGVLCQLLDEIDYYLRYTIWTVSSATTTEENMFEYRESIFKHLYDLPMYCPYWLLALMSDYKILRQVCRHLRDFYGLECIADNKTRTEYLYPRYQMILDRVTQFCFDLWTGDLTGETKLADYVVQHDVPACSFRIASQLMDIIPLELDVLYICTSKIKKQPSSTELNGWVKQILKASPRILQNYLILLQGRMEGALAVNYALTQSINVMMEFLLIFLTDIPKRFIHREKLNDMLAHVGVLTRKISILLEESSETNINDAEFSAPNLWQEIERMKADIRQIFLKAPYSSQLCFPMDDGFLFLNHLLRHLNDLLISNVYSVALIKKEIEMVKESLEFLRSSFGKVRQTLDDTRVVKDCWVRALKVAYEAERVINCILSRDKALSHLIFSLPSVTDKIKLIVEEVTSLQLEDKNGDDPLDAKSSDKSDESTSSSFVEVTVGHEENEAWIIDQLLDEHESELDVISIVGMPGLGKSTLANQVYKNTLVVSHFNVRAWCTVSQKYNKSKVLGEILQQVSGSGNSENDLAEMLREALYDKRYLIVLDDVWDIATAEMLMACFPKVKRGNRIILTSRSSKVGWEVKCRSDPLLLQLLKSEKSWELFEKRIFGVQGSCPAELSDIGHQIVEKCQGLPLALVLIAGVILRGREGKEKEKDLWIKIQDNLDSFISANNNLQMMKVMQLSYDHLPYHLKPLLLHFGRSQKNKRTPVSKLMQLWITEGLVDHDIPSESAQSYLKTLISSSLIMVDHNHEINGPFLVVTKACYVHDIVHDFCSVKAKKEKFLKLINTGAPVHASDFLHRRPTIHTEEGQLQKRLTVLFSSDKSSSGSKNLISLKVSGSIDKSKSIKIGYICQTRHLRLLRVLQLDHIILGGSSAEEIGSLFHLRFLRIRANLEAIPMSWVNLQNLETLSIKIEFHVMVLLPRILKLSKLKHASIEPCSFFKVDYYTRGYAIMDQPSRILEADDSKLEGLTTLSKVLFSYAEGTNDALEKFPNLQHLHCLIKEPTDPPTEGDWFPKLDVLTKLESLMARYEAVNPYSESKIPPLKEYNFPHSLKELRLCCFPMTSALFSEIAALPELEILEINSCDFVEQKWDASEDIYQSLKTLSLVYVRLSEWEVDSETFPKLEELILKRCYRLSEIPSAFADIDSLKSIRVFDDDLVNSAMEIKNEVKAIKGEDRPHVLVG